MTVQLSYLVAEDAPNVYVLARVGVDRAPDEATPDRPPVNLALAIDRSSSMRGPRIGQAIRAARELANRLDQRDRFSLVIFDASARIAFGPAPITDANRDELMSVFDQVETGLGTNLAAGWKKATEAVASGFVRGAVARVMLLTDGQASIGITDASRLAELAQQEAARGVTTTCMGIGEGFDDELLSEIARRGGGGFYYLATPESIPAAFGSELSGVFSIVATGTELKLMPDDDVVSAEVLHRIPARPAGDGLVVELGDVAAGPPRQVLFKIHREPTSEGRRVGTLMLTYRSHDGAPGDAAILGIELPQLVLTEHSAVVTLERLRLEVATAVDEAWARRGFSQRNEASCALMRVKQLVTRARDDKRADPAALGELVQEIGRAEVAIASGAEEREKARRGLRERSQLTLLGHSTVRPLPEPDED